MTQDLNSLRHYLEREFQARSKVKSMYSKRAFSRDLGLSPTTLSEFLKGKRNLNFQNIDRIFKYLDKKRDLTCSWCDKPKKLTKLLVGGPRQQYICDSCIDTCVEIVQSGKKMG